MLRTLMLILSIILPSISLAQQNNDWVAVFYSPHQDDEAIAMGAAMREHIDAGRPVWLVLLVRGATTPCLDDDPGCMTAILKGTVNCTAPWLHGTSGNYKHNIKDETSVLLTQQQMITARNVEFIESARQLGVTDVFIVNDATGIPDADCSDSARDSIADVIRRFDRLAYSRTGKYASHKVLSGLYDDLTGNKPDYSPTGFRWVVHGTHRASWMAATFFRENCKLGKPKCAGPNSSPNVTECCIDDIVAYRGYRYWTDKGNSETCEGEKTFASICYNDKEKAACSKTPEPIEVATDYLSPPANPQQITRLDWKAKALDEYFYWNPSAGRYAIGAHSVGDLLINAGATRKTDLYPIITNDFRLREFIDEVK